jgi:DNA-directed RNA polymerase sigma subunit (sigma70/sigma32)
VADRAIRARLGRVIGHRTVSLDDERAGSFSNLVGPERVTATEYEYLVAERADVQEFDVILRRLTSARDHEIVVEYLVQQAHGDPSPSHTVADLFGLGRPAVRQVVSRSLRRVRGVTAAC